MKSRLIIVCLIAIAIMGCDRFTRKHQVGTVAEVNGHSLYSSDLIEITRGLSGQDSIDAAEHFIRQWATEILLYEKSTADPDKQMEQLVEDYRRSLYVHLYEQRLINHHLSTNIDEAEIDSFYHLHADEYVLKQTIAHGVMVILPLSAPDQSKIKNWLLELDEANLERIEKYCYQYSSRYQLFTEQWVTQSQIQLWLPPTITDLSRRLRPQQQIIYEDSISIYILQTTDVCQQGSPMPTDYALPEIQKVLLHERQIAFIEEERKKIYDEAVRFNKVKLYEN